MATSPKAKAPKNSPIRPWKREPGWDKLAPGEEKRLEEYCADYIDFISDTKTERRVHDHLLALAKKQGFQDLDQVARGKTLLKPGDGVYRSMDGKTLLLARVGKAPLEEGLNLVGGHADCPRLDLKPCPLYQDEELVLLDTHYYGGIKHYQWLAMPLAIYGVIIRRDGTKVEVAIGDGPKDPVFCITDILPHLDVDQSKQTMREGVRGEKLNVVCGSRPVSKEKEDKEIPQKAKLNILHLLRETYGIEEEDFASAELEVVPAGRARELGFDRSMVLGYGQDDRVCSYAAARAVLDFQGIPQRTMGALVVDKEEIGSYGRTGMDSTFLPNSVAELVAATQKNYSDLVVRRALEHTRMLSADVGTLADPDYKGANSDGNMGRLNCGLQINKYDGHGGKGGASDASAEFMAHVRKVFNDGKVVWQLCELGRPDVGGGGTIALYMARLGIEVVDCGVGLLCMHAPWEIAGKLDIYMAYKGYAAFLANA